MEPLGDLGCPVCRGSTDPREQLLTTLCPAHLAVAEAEGASQSRQEELLAAFEQGVRDQIVDTANRLGLSVEVLLRLRFV